MRKLIVILFVLMLILSGCSTEQTKEKMVLNIGLMPAVDTAPIFLAKDSGYFEENNLEVNIEVYTSAQDRQSALQANAIDGAMTDILAVATNVNGGFDLKAVMLTDGMFILASNEGAIDKSDISVGMMEISVSNFLVDQWLGDTHNIEKVYVNAIPARMEAAITGQLDMALLPEPIATVAELNGLEKLIFEPVDGFSPDVMAFTQTAIDLKSDAIQAFVDGYNKAVLDIQKDESLARDAIINNVPNVSPDLKDLMNLPQYHQARLPSEEYIQKVIDWTNTILPEPMTVEPQDLIETQFID